MKPADILSIVESSGTDLSWQKDLYEWFHKHPEISGEEVHTAQKIEEFLRGFDCEITTGVGGHGIVAIFSNGEGPTVLMRADFDALPVLEDTGAPYASTNTGVMHACGHDMHTTALLGACAILDATRDAWSGTFIALFQPAEETTEGASKMLADGVTSMFPHPDVCFAQHIVPGPAGAVMTKPGPALAACDTITITIHGRSAHGSMPHLSVDPTIVAAMIVLRLQAIVGREVHPGDFAVITVGKLTAGTRNNIIPDSAELVLNTRFYDEELRDRVYASIERVVKAECDASACPREPEVAYSSHGNLTNNDEEVFNRIRPVFDEAFGEDSIDAIPWTASEDFPEIPLALGSPYVYWTVGITPRALWETHPEGAPSNHQPTFLPDYERTMPATTKAAVLAALTYLAS